MSLIEIKKGYQLVSRHSVVLDGKTMTTEIVRVGNGEDYLVTSQFEADDTTDNEATSPRRVRPICGYCSGKLVGCVDCDGPGVELNCVTGTISCT